MTVLTEGRHTAEFLASEANGFRSRETITLASGETLEAGTVLGVSTTTGKYAGLNPDSTAGYEDATAVLYDNCDATAGDIKAVIVARDAEVKRDALVWPDGIEEADKTAALEALAAKGIVAR
ncbi:head decoration protein [Salinisphaera sp. T31B1]|uniref:head decoration protein n=1 Tax=Salinisphaera sp. T31B1 TaxID=727963 RepID=UPI00334059BE